MLWKQVTHLVRTPTVYATALLLATATRAHLCQRQCPRSSLTSFTPDHNNFMAQPKLIVFDLDYTLWPFWVDTHVDPPFQMASNGKVYDAHKRHVKHYEDVPDILKKLHSEGFKLGIASRTGAVQEAADLTRLFNWDQYFHYRQIYPGSKITHFKNMAAIFAPFGQHIRLLRETPFKKLHAESGIPYKDMLFFDDEHRNIADVSTLGVTCMFVPDGISHKSFKEGMELFRKQREAGVLQS